MAAEVKRTLTHARFGFLGGYYSGMLDMYSDLTMLSAQTGMDVEILEMSDLDAYLREVKVEDKKEIWRYLWGTTRGCLARLRS